MGCVPNYSHKPPPPLYRVYASCCISKGKGERDPFFTVFTETDKPVYISGDEAMIKIKASRKVYLSIFHLSTKDKVRVLLPNQFQKRQFIEEGKEFIFPS